MSEQEQAAANSGSVLNKSLTPEQQLALRTDRNISVTAGAGSGKTTILVERYLRLLLEEKTPIRRVLAITFTEKAASEMTERVARRLNQLLQDPLPAEQHARLLELREQLNSAQISTIHAFCARLLREYAVASGIDPDFGIIKEFQQSVIVEDAIDSVFASLNDGTLISETGRDEWKELLRQIPVETLRQAMQVALRQPYEMSLASQRLAENDDEALMSEFMQLFFAELGGWLHPEALRRQTLPLLGGLLAAGLDNTALKPKGQELFALAAQTLTLPLNDPQDGSVWQALLDMAGLACNQEGNPYKNLSGIGLKKDLGEAYDLLFELSETLSPLALFRREVFANAPGDTDRLHLLALRRFLQLYQAVEAIYRNAKEERGLLDFDDLQLLVLHMLRENEQVRDSLRNRYSAVMVDEFQDTNSLQWDIISLLGLNAAELESKFFVVGDPKQSIYGFRNADVRVFQQVKETFAGTSGKGYDGNVVLTQSFRFLPSINHFVNHLFRRLLVEDGNNRFEVGYEDLQTRRSSADNGYIELALLNSEDEEQADQESYLARTIAQLLASDVQVYRPVTGRESLHAIRPGDIAILIPRRTQLLDLESRLREFGIPFKTIGGIGFYRRQEIFDVYYLLRFLSNPEDNLALVSVLRSPFAGVSDTGLYWLEREPGHNWWEKLQQIADLSHYSSADREALPLVLRQLLRWRRRRDRLSLSQLLDDIFEESFYRATQAAEWNGEQMLANLEKVIDLCRDYEQSGFIALADFIETLHRLIHQDPREGEAQIALEDEGTVKIMTIHQAKGLEFPVVFCPYLQQGLRPQTGRMLLDPDYGLALKLRDPRKNYQEVEPFLFSLIAYRRRQKELAERKRLLYVAATRARDRLYLCGSYKSNTLDQQNPLAWTVTALQTGPVDAGTAIHPAKQVQLFISDGSNADAPPAAKGSTVSNSLAQLQQALQASLTAGPGLTDLLALSDTPSGETFSATQLLTFQRDPEAYFQRYHQGFFASDYEFIRQSRDGDSISLLKGKIVHLILEHGPVTSEEEIGQRLEHAFFRYEVFDPAVQQLLRGEIPAYIIPFCQTDLARQCFAAGNWRAETSLTMRLEEDYFTGTLDLIYRNAAAEWEVLDYKTNNVSAAEVEKEAMKYDMQIKAYALLLSHLQPGQRHYAVALYFLKPGGNYRRVYAATDIPALEEEFVDLINAIKLLPPFA